MTTTSLDTIASIDLDKVTGGGPLGAVIGGGSGLLVGGGLASLACGPAAPACMAIGLGAGLLAGAYTGSKLISE